MDLFERFPLLPLPSEPEVAATARANCFRRCPANRAALAAYRLWLGISSNDLYISWSLRWGLYCSIYSIIIKNTNRIASSIDCSREAITHPRTAVNAAQLQVLVASLGNGTGGLNQTGTSKHMSQPFDFEQFLGYPIWDIRYIYSKCHYLGVSRSVTPCHGDFPISSKK